MSNFVKAIGTFNFNSIHTVQKAENHLVIPLHVNETVYELDINIGSNTQVNQVQYVVITHQMNSFPYSDEIHSSQFNYKQNLNLTESMFTDINENGIVGLIKGIAKDADKIIVFGTEWENNIGKEVKKGIHEIHMNSIHDTTNTDGIIAFYSAKETKITWVALKFHEQQLGC